MAKLVINTKSCPMCGRVDKVVVEKSDYKRFINKEASVQDCFPYLTKDVREQLLTGYCAKCWDELWNDNCGAL